MDVLNSKLLQPVIGDIPYRLALAGGWIDQPFVSRLNPNGVGSMVVVSIEANIRFMERCGFATGTRKVAERLWGPSLPKGDPYDLMRELYAAENEGQKDPSGSQDMAGLLYPGVSRLDYDGDYFPCHIERCLDEAVADWIEQTIYVLPVAPRPAGYSPLGIQNLDPGVIRELGETGQRCYQALLNRDSKGLGESFNTCMDCWASLLPHVVHHPSLEVDLAKLLACYQAEYPGAMYSGCGGGYLYVVSDEPVPGGFTIKVRRK